jgi:uncharacterized protein (DUF305 family)
MNNKTLLYALAGLLTSSTLVGLLIMGSSQARTPEQIQNLQNPSTQTNPRQRKMMGEVDKHFIEMMIPHHDGAIEMAELALSSAKHPEIKKLAQAIIKDQNREIKQMQTWYKEWYGTEVPATPMPGMGMMGMHQGMMRMSMHPDRSMHLDTLKKASDFDREFIREMIPHHQTAVMMARMVVNSGTHPELRNLAQSMIKTQTAEIQQMQQWYQNWYQ